MKKILLLLITISHCQLFAQIKISTNSSILCEGVNVNIEATGIPTNATLQWQKNGIDIQNATATTYQTSSSGNYSVKAVSQTNSWLKKTPVEDFPTLYDVCFVSEKIGYAVGAQGTIIKTIDAGVSWQKQTSNSTEEFRAVFFTDEQNGWAVGANNSILKTQDGGKKWTIIPKTWDYYGYFENIYFVNNKVGWVINGWNSTILKTTNGGDSWIVIPTLPSAYIGVYAFFFTDENTGWGADYFGSIYKTTNGGVTWVENTNMNKIKPHQYGIFKSIYFTDSNHGWAITDDLIISTSNGGISWTIKYDSNTLVLNSIQFSDSQNGIAFGYGYEYLQTTDGGNTWVKKPTGFNSPLMYASYVFGKNNIWAVGEEGVVTNTIDGGLNWKILRGNPQKLTDIYFVNSSIGYKVGYGLIEKTSDGGNTWTKQNSGTNYPLSKVKFVDENNGWALNQRSILRTIDGGNTWTNNTIFNNANTVQYSNSMFFNDAKNGFVVGNKNIISNTKDGGVTWNKVKTTLDSNGTLNSIFFADTKNGWAVGHPGNVMKTNDGGATWQRVNMVEKYNNDNYVSVWFTDVKNGWLLSQNEHILKTTDGGITWSEFNIPGQALKSVIFANNKTGWIIGYSGLLLKTIDGGNTWEPQQYNSSKELNGLFFFNAENGWAVGKGNTLLKYELQVFATSNTITINPKPNIPNITWSDNEGRLIATSTTQPVLYAWFKDNNQIKNSPSAYYVPTSSGSYSVRVTNSNFCSEFSKSIVVNILSSDNPFQTSYLKVYPNPNNDGVLKIEYSNSKIDKNAELQIIGIDGLSVHKQKLEILNNTLSCEVDVSNLSSGIYFLQIISNDQKSVVKISIVR